ncbi:MAG: hypothetical protein AUG51_23730 [Acidobacteria bacterium 13_1_20CM_3_53_8]|nr:MAG: hypothetical protein AUG51_23730 [Acidobacteria bacterium 13_1_20CM_3_53_8]
MKTKSVKTETDGRARRKTVALLMIIVLGLSCAAAVSRLIEARRPPIDVAQEEENLYVSGATAKRMSLGFDGLVADWYWMRSLQYVGRKVIARGDDLQFEDLKQLDLRLLAPLLDTTTTLDPQFMAAYDYGAALLPAIEQNDAAIALLKKGIAANPSEWRLYHLLAYIHWQRGEYVAAGELYHKGAQINGAPPWMEAMSAKMAAEGGSRSVARQMYQQMYEQSDDEQVKHMAKVRLMQLDSLDERDRLRRVLQEFNSRSGRCASSWREVAPVLRALHFRLNETGAPLDPTDAPYVLTARGCDVGLVVGSHIPEN